MATTYPKFIRQDWGDREIVKHYLDKGIPYPSPDVLGPTDPSSEWGAYVNKKEKVIRLVDAATGQPYPLQIGNELFASYFHRDPTFKIVQDDASIAQWGEREVVAVSPDRQFDELVTRLAEAEVRDKAQPRLQIECEVFDDIYQVGDTVRFVLPELGIDEELMVYEIERSFDAQVRKHYPQRDYGQSVKIKAGAKITKDLRQILDFLNKNINALGRAYSMSDFDSISGFCVPVQWVRIFPENMAIKESVSFKIIRRGYRINEGRINISRIVGSAFITAFFEDFEAW